MFQEVVFNTKEKMIKCFNKLVKDKARYAHTFYFISPERYTKETKYWVYYLPRR